MLLAFILGGATLVIFGCLIWFGGMIELTAGYDPEKVTDKKGLGKFIGSHLLILGVLLLAVGLLAIFIPSVPFPGYLILYIVLVLLFCIKILFGSKKFEKE